MTKIDDFMKAPYTRLVIPDFETGTFTAEVLEFSGCRVQADTADDAYSALNNAMREWLRVEIASNHTIPPPSITRGYSGHIALRIPRSIHKHAARMAEREGVSLNQFLVSSISAAVGAVNMYYDLSRRLRTEVMRAVITATAISSRTPAFAPAVVSTRTLAVVTNG